MQLCKLCRFGLHWFRADYNVCHSKKLFLSSSIFMGHLTGMRYSLFRGWTRLFIIPNPNIHYSFSFKPCYYSLFSFHPQNIWYNQLLSNWLPINYLLITHWFHWCHRLVSSRVSSGKRRLLCGATSKVNRHELGGRIGLHWTGIELRKSDLICWHLASKTRRKGGRLQKAVQTFSDSCSPVFVVFVVCAPSYCRSATCFTDSLKRFRMEWCWVSWFKNQHYKHG